jgi:FtsZ-binding cell division protein ZapB
MENVCGDDEILKRHSAKTLNISMGGALFITDYKIDTSSVVTLFFDHEVSKFKEEINTIKEEINTIKEEINTIKEEMNTIKEEMNTIFKVFSNRHIKLKGRAVRRRNLGKGQYEVAVAFIENTEGTAVDLQQFIMNLESGFGEEL